MGQIFSGKGDVNVVGVVGSTEPKDKGDSKKDDKEVKPEATNTGIMHTGRGEVWVNGKQQ